MTEVHAARCKVLVDGRSVECRIRGRLALARRVERMGTERRPLFEYARRSEPATAYQALYDEIEERLARHAG